MCELATSLRYYKVILDLFSSMNKLTVITRTRFSLRGRARKWQTRKQVGKQKLHEMGDYGTLETRYHGTFRNSWRRVVSKGHLEWGNTWNNVIIGRDNYGKVWNATKWRMVKKNREHWLLTNMECRDQGNTETGEHWEVGDTGRWRTLDVGDTENWRTLGSRWHWKLENTGK